MNVGVCQIHLRLPDNHSLKEKRHVLKSIISQVQNRFNVSAAEVEDNDLWQRATIGVAVVSNDKRHTNEVLSKIADFVGNGRFEAEMLDYDIEIISL